MQHPPFTALARVYDAIMSDVDYEAWCDFLLAEAEKRGYPEGPALDLGCGTGNVTIPLARRGLELTGVDASAEMLALARRKAPRIDWRLGEFTTFELDRRFALAVSVFDSLNNLLTPELFLAAAVRVRSHLRPGGLFLFDVNTRAGLSDLWEGESVQGWADSVYYRWDHSFDAKSNLSRVDVYCDDGRRSFNEVHFERPYDPDEVTALLSEAGFAGPEAISFPDGSPARGGEERIWALARAP